MLNVYDPPRECWLYPDRGIQKWQGWFLSDHTSALEKAEQQTSDFLIFPAQSQLVTQQILSEAYEDDCPVQLQLKQIQEDQTLVNIQGTILTLTKGGLTLRNRESGLRQTIELSEIRHVRLVAVEKWYYKDAIRYDQW